MGKKIRRRVQALLLAMVMVLSVFQGIPGTWFDWAKEAQAASRTQAEALQWVRAQVGHGVNAGNQCVGLILGYYDFLGVPRSSGYAYQYTSNAYPSDRGWQRIRGAAPQPGDILIYTGSNTGHVAIYESENVTYHQNWKSHSYVEKVTGRYDRITTSNKYWGVIRPNFNVAPAPVNYTVNTGGASGMSNTAATISGSLSPSGTAASWGFELGENQNAMQRYTASGSAASSANMSANTAAFQKLKPGTTYYYRVWAHVNNQVKTGGIQSFRTTAVKPEIPKLKADGNSKEIGIGDSPSVSWNSVSEAEYYKLKLYGPDGALLETSENVTGNKYAFKAIEKEGTYTVSVESCNSVGSKGESDRVEITAHSDVTVRFWNADSFVDVEEGYEPEVLSEQTVHWGKSAAQPASPSHKGYTFKKWDGSYQNVKQDTDVKAVYDINSYTVKFVNSLTSEELKTQKVEYCGAAEPADYDVPTGYVKTGYDGWDKDYARITEDTTFYSCIGWYNEDFPIYAQAVSAVREYDAKESDNEGYTVNVKLTNWDQKTTKGRVVIALKTKKGKLLTTTESSAFSIKKSGVKTLEIFVPYNKAASIAEAYVIGQYQDAVPITTTASNNAEIEIDQSMTYTDWSEEQPPENVALSESRQEYRYQDKTTTTSYATSLPGYTQSGSRWVETGSGRHDYVNSWHGGFNQNHWLYSTYSAAPPTAFENSMEKRTVWTCESGQYIYWHWCTGNNYSDGPYNRFISRYAEYPAFHAFYAGEIGYNAQHGVFQYSNPAVCKDTYWWYSVDLHNPARIPIYQCHYTNYRKQFDYYKWSDFSEWGTTPYESSGTRNVETRTVYRYQSDEMMKEDDSGKERVVSGSLGSEFAGKEAALFIYKVDGASDYTNEYVAQTVLDEEGNYEFAFKLREEPTAETGDFTIALGVEGTSTAIFLEKIEAPKKEYTVTFYNYNGKVISQETVEEGGAAKLPSEESLAREGYTFTRWSDTNTNITEDKALYPEYKLNTYHVVFIDWEANTVEVKEFEYGAQLVAPQPQAPEEGKTAEWDAIADGNTVVTDNMIVTTRYTAQTCRVQIMDFDNKVISDEAIRYGEAANLPDIDIDDEKYIFLGWKNIANGSDEAMGENIIKQNVILCPEYIYKETTPNPVASVSSGTYDAAKKVVLSCPDENASIYYTLDGSDPKGYNAILYTEPIMVEGATELKFYAGSIGKNDSEIQRELYAVNYEGAMSEWMLRNDLPEEVKADMDFYKVYTETGYAYKDVKKTTLSQEAASLEASGWTLAENEEEYTNYSDWSQEMPNDTGEYLALDIDSEILYSSETMYQYSHYKYEEGTATQYAADEPEGAGGVYEETEPFQKKLNLAGFDRDGNPYYVYDGQTWYNQTRVTGKVASGTKYRWRCKVASYEKWSGYSVEEPAPDEKREYREADVYSYERHNAYIVKIHADAIGVRETYAFLAEEGSKIDAKDYENILGYDFGGFYTDKEYRNRWDCGKNTVSGNLDLYAKYVPGTYTVTFFGKDGEEISSQTVSYLEAARAPEMEDADGYRFAGWDTSDYLNVSYDMQVRAKYIPEDEYATVTLDNEAVTLYVGKSIGLSAQIQPPSHAGDDLEWMSDDETVATVSDQGIVTAVKQGSAVVTVKVIETGETSSCKITVKVNLDTTLCLLKNSALSVDAHGFLRGMKAGANTVEKICREFENDTIVCKDKKGKELEETALFGTGNKALLIRNGKVLDEIEAVMTADLSGDGIINNRDVSFLSRALLEKEVPEDSQILAGDVNGDGEVNNRDVALISRYLVGKEKL